MGHATQRSMCVKTTSENLGTLEGHASQRHRRERSMRLEVSRSVHRWVPRNPTKRRMSVMNVLISSLGLGRRQACVRK